MQHINGKLFDMMTLFDRILLSELSMRKLTNKSTVDNTTVVYGILGVSGSLGHEPDSKDLQNKQGTSIGVSTGSPMLKLGREIESIDVSFSVVYFHIPLCCHSFLIYEGGG